MITLILLRRLCKYIHTRAWPFARLIRLLRSPDLHRLHPCRDSLCPKGRDGRIVYHPVVLDSLFRLRASPGGHK